MSYKNLKLNTWTHPTTGEVRVYIDTRYVDRRNMMSFANGSWISEGNSGMCVFNSKHIGSNGDSIYIGMQEVACVLSGVATVDGWENPSAIMNIGFADLVSRISGSQTKGGNFSLTRYLSML